MRAEDRELLDQAAKAIGGGSYAELNKYSTMHSDGDSWNPLTEDGDALRLLARIPLLETLRLDFWTRAVEVGVSWSPGKFVRVTCAGECADRARAIRYAIVRAAAEIGKKLP